MSILLAKAKRGYMALGIIILDFVIYARSLLPKPIIFASLKIALTRILGLMLSSSCGCRSAQTPKILNIKDRHPCAAAHKEGMKIPLPLPR